ncbi:FAD-binding oxidoreductase [Spirosoma sp. KNUC1025]|uniref:FAD-binding oxidoreductase n=1 Tax=Spirosoma sp. KNUC1025 TaxID=2894082 RepID=UPI00386EC99A|nr:FAD-dependent oxidoreductase [Spirosoma sp. KNUC1025]
METIVASDLQSRLQGPLITPEHPEYHTARKVYNGMIDKHPALIARCSSVDDVVTMINYARENALLVAIKGGGHNGAGLGVCDDGLVIDLSGMKRIEVDPDKRTVWVEGGCLLRELDAATHAYGLVVPTGINGTTGVAGLTLGGGLGYLTRHCGLTIDNLLEANMVLADGRVVKASARENEDLFWAIRGEGEILASLRPFCFMRTRSVL